MGSNEAIELMVNYCGVYCVNWRDTIKTQLINATRYGVQAVRVELIGPKQYDILFQLYNPKNQHSILENWFGTACCENSAEAMAYQDYYRDNF